MTGKDEDSTPFPPGSVARKWWCYVRALCVLIMYRSRCASWITDTEESVEYRLWPVPDQQHLFYDIDDTLNSHGEGLTKEVCVWLDSMRQRGKDVVLLTNCSGYRAEFHRNKLRLHNCQAELWSVGRKPDYRWIQKVLAQRNWKPEKCAMYGDRPTMDLWGAQMAGFSKRVWVKGWGRRRTNRTLLQWIQHVEWRLLGSRV